MYILPQLLFRHVRENESVSFYLFPFKKRSPWGDLFVECVFTNLIGFNLSILSIGRLTSRKCRIVLLLR